jgi:hypothetical protein
MTELIKDYLLSVKILVNLIYVFPSMSLVHTHQTIERFRS